MMDAESLERHLTDSFHTTFDTLQPNAAAPSVVRRRARSRKRFLLAGGIVLAVAVGAPATAAATGVWNIEGQVDPQLHQANGAPPQYVLADSQAMKNGWRASLYISPDLLQARGKDGRCIFVDLSDPAGAHRGGAGACSSPEGHKPSVQRVGDVVAVTLPSTAVTQVRLSAGQQTSTADAVAGNFLLPRDLTNASAVSVRGLGPDSQSLGEWEIHPAAVK